LTLGSRLFLLSNFEYNNPMQASTANPVKTAKSGLFKRFKNVVADCRATFKESGFKGVVKRYGWKIFAVFFVYYLVRDIILYILIPWMIAKHFIN
jgi:hypothetical protein